MKSENSTYLDSFNGFLTALRHWSDLDQLVIQLSQNAPQGWFIYAVGEDPPTEPATAEQFNSFLDRASELLKREHDEAYCGIVYVDNKQSPGFIKIYDPANLGSVCGFSDTRTLPGWTLSKAQPVNLHDAFPPPRARARWWRKLFPAA